MFRCDFVVRPVSALLVGGLIFTSVTGCLTQHDSQPTPTTHGETAQGETVSSESTAETKTIPIRVNTMTCVAGCFNGIQMVLKKRPGIEEIKLAPQKSDEGEVDNSVIYVSYRGDLDKAEIERTIVGAGFDSIEFLEEGTPSSTTE